MRIGNLDGRLVILIAAGAVDVERASDGRFGSGPQDIYDRWTEFTGWAADSGLGSASAATAPPDAAHEAGAEPFDVALLDAPSPAPGSRSVSASTTAITSGSPGSRYPSIPASSRSSRAASPARMARSSCRPAGTRTGKSSSSRSSARQRTA